MAVSRFRGSDSMRKNRARARNDTDVRMNRRPNPGRENGRNHVGTTKLGEQDGKGVLYAHFSRTYVQHAHACRLLHARGL